MMCLEERTERPKGLLIASTPLRGRRTTSDLPRAVQRLLGPAYGPVLQLASCTAFRWTASPQLRALPARAKTASARMLVLSLGLDSDTYKPAQQRLQMSRTLGDMCHLFRTHLSSTCAPAAKSHPGLGTPLHHCQVQVYMTCSSMQLQGRVVNCGCTSGRLVASPCMHIQHAHWSPALQHA